MIARLISLLPQRTRTAITNSLLAGLAVPSKDPSNGNSIGSLNSTRDISPIERREAVSTHRLLRDRVPFVRGLINNFVDLALGVHGMLPIFKSGDDEYDARALAYYQRYTRRQTWDVTGQDNGASMQRLVLRTMMTDGEVFGLKIVDGFGKPQRQLIVTDQVGEQWGSSVSKPSLIDGIEYNAVNKPVRYWVTQYTPGDGYSRSASAVAKDARYVQHVYDRERATQKRGLPWGYTGLNHGLSTIDTGKLIEVTMKMNASLIATMETQDGNVANAFKGVLAAAKDHEAAATAPASDTERATRFIDVYGSQIPIFKVGEGMKLHHGRSAANEIEWLGWLAAQYSQGLGLPVEIIVGIATGSAATHANADIVQRKLQAAQSIITDDWNQPNAEHILANGILAYYFPDAMPGTEPLQPPSDVARYADITWRGPRGYQVNKSRDAKANADLVARGMMSMEEFWMANGEDPDKAERTVLSGTRRRYEAWLEAGFPEERFWQREFGPNVQAAMANTDQQPTSAA